MRCVVGPDPSKWEARWLFDVRGTFLREDGKKLTQGEFADKLVRDGIDLGPTDTAKNVAEALRIRYGRWEKGTDQIPDGLIAAIVARYKDRGVKPPTQPRPPVSDMDRLIDANLRLARAIEKQNENWAALTDLLTRVGRLEESQNDHVLRVGIRFGELDHLVRSLPQAASASAGNDSEAAGK